MYDAGFNNVDLAARLPRNGECLFPASEEDGGRGGDGMIERRRPTISKFRGRWRRRERM